jgi:predicted AAA+ superfamily ATPase
MAEGKSHHNPYDFISPVKDPELFAGRHDELKEIEYYLQLSKNDKPKYFHLALVGPRSAGKTSLLNMIGHAANKLQLLPKNCIECRNSEKRCLVLQRSF